MRIPRGGIKTQVSYNGGLPDGRRDKPPVFRREKCHTESCRNTLTGSNPLDRCNRCQELGIKGNPRVPINA